MQQDLNQSFPQGSLILKDLPENELQDFARKIATCLTRGDVIFLHGDLGAGKSTFARALIRALSNDDDLEVPSPTFPLLIPYETDRMEISHFDLYRLGDPSEVEELGLYEGLESNLTLIEWPEQLGTHNITDRIEIWLEDNEEGNSRTLTIKANGKAQAKLIRLKAILEFLSNTSWAGANWTFLQGDASTRSYIRLNNQGQTALLMNAPRQPDGPPIRDGKPYSQIAHLAEDMLSFVAIAKTLATTTGSASTNVSMPEIFHHDIENGLLLISDFGDAQYYDLIVNQGADIKKLYEPAIDLLLHIRQQPPAPMQVDDKTYSLPAYDNIALGIETELVTDWYWPYVKNGDCSEGEKETFQSIWKNLFKELEGTSNHWVLRDFHSPNLMHLADKTGMSSVGVIDFQDAVEGHPAYDLVSLCQDARLTIPKEIEQYLKSRYISAATNNEPDFDPENLKAAYAILGAQRASKLLGIFVRLCQRDGKAHYLAHIPRIWDYLERNLSHPKLSALNEWYAVNFPANLRTEFFTKKIQLKESNDE